MLWVDFYFCLLWNLSATFLFRIVVNPDKRPYNMSEVILWTLDDGNTINTLELENDNEECYYFERLERVLATQVWKQAGTVLCRAQCKLKLGSLITTSYFIYFFHFKIQGFPYKIPIPATTSSHQPMSGSDTPPIPSLHIKALSIECTLG